MATTTVTGVFSSPVEGMPMAAEGVPVAQPVGGGVPIAVARPVESDSTPLRSSGSGRNYRFREPRIIIVDYPSHPPGAPPGGVWVEAQFFGASSAFCCCAWAIIFWPIALCIPFMPCDSTILYRAPDGTLWHEDGSFEGV
mmetsp:Transcript_14167/g.36717  ORF Transcript_14167/g.36717 Transcript_14167/m.36717 type:complete len:140 (+) Transcript_14167:40-459(+)|eukprot:CAMPEP_0115863200 /NCGR_PEP_ID=MMETSP0287-20121206/18570_1 /TAXON_ID=412157 /ORGANISM="Chrysochromulina rotalis, Strain UIO044" /LENGTH=139 /DNA_ID=CAMNT_0003317647 /DNA_START=22 /DNA_END=441 /DNA_ORIENTATION=+